VDGNAPQVRVDHRRKEVLYASQNVSPPDLSLNEARRIALAAQGLIARAPAGVTG